MHIINLQNRLHVFDAMRSFAMLSVVFIHCLNSMNLGNDKTFPGEIILTYFMPLFFFISGFFAFKDEDKWDLKYCQRYLANKIKALVICPIIFYALLHLIKDENPVGWLQTGFKEYWFVIALFVIALIYMFFNLVSRLVKYNISVIAMLATGLIGLGILASHKFTDEYRFYRIFEIANTCYFIQFFSIGILCRKYQRLFERIILSTALYSSGLIIYIICIISKYNVEALNNGLISVINSFIIQYLGTFIVMSIFLKNKKAFESNNIVSKWICKVGSRTLDIYMLHYFFIPPLLIFHDFFEPKAMFTLQLIAIGSLTLAITQLCLTCSYMIRISPFLTEWLFGVKLKRSGCNHNA